MIQIGIDVSPALLAGLDANIIDLDFIEVGGGKSLDVVQQALAFKPVLIHDVSSQFWLNYDNPFVEPTMTHARALLDATKPAWFSTGIGASAEPQGHTLPFWRGADASQLQTREKVHDNILRNATKLQDWLGLPLLLENYNYHPTNAYEYVCEPEFFSALINAIGCGVLLDISHSRISAHNMKWGDVRDYMQALPLDKVREVHIAHPKLDGDQMLDMHQPIDASDLDTLAWVLDHCPAEALTLEVVDGVTPEQLAAQARMMREVTTKIRRN